MEQITITNEPAALLRGHLRLPDNPSMASSGSGRHLHKPIRDRYPLDGNLLAFPALERRGYSRLNFSDLPATLPSPIVSKEVYLMFKTIFYILTSIIVVAQLYAIFGNLYLGNVHGQTIWMVAPITVLCFGVLAIIEAIDKRKGLI